MTNVPIEFRTFDIVKNDTLHLSYVFDVINAVEPSEGILPIKQDDSIKALHLNLAGKTSNPNISVAIDGETHLFTLNHAYITDRYPHLKDAIMKHAFVIEGYSLSNITKERVLIFLPMTTTSETNNAFYPLEQAIINKTPVSGLTFNEYIPNTKISTDYYTYYTHTDNDGCLYHIIYFDTSDLKYTSGLTVKIPKNDTGYSATYKVTNYRTATLAKKHDNMNEQYEDNIYIDCVPVELENQTVVKYMKASEQLGTYYSDMLMYIVYIIIITLVVYVIYSINNYASKVGAPKPVASLK